MSVDKAIESKPKAKFPLARDRENLASNKIKAVARALTDERAFPIKLLPNQRQTHTHMLL